MNLSDCVNSTLSNSAPWLHFFLYGDTGSSKTTIASTFPRPLFLVPQMEKSEVTLAGQDHKYIEILGRYDPIIRNAEGVSQAGLDAVVAMIERDYRANPNTFPFDTIVFESISHYVEMLQEEITEGNKKQMDPQKWGIVAMHFRNIQKRLRALDLHVIYTALADTNQDSAGTVRGGPALPGKTRTLLPSACDIVAYCEATRGKEPKYRVHFRGYDVFMGRSRIKGIPHTIENCTFDLLRPYLNVQNPAAGGTAG